MMWRRFREFFGRPSYPEKPVRLQVFMRARRTGELRVLCDLQMTAAAAYGALKGTPGRFESERITTQEAEFTVAVWFE